MGAKRALIVDDSKSARLFLARMLEKYEIDVDSAENAEAAIEYLASHRPDVIFMDHLMPGMDGFQAVQAIKNNPVTATIPIMMYTSQEGELYLGQARALGAVGVMPKQIKPADVSKVLYQLHLLADRRSAYQTSFRPAAAPQGSEVPPPEQVAANDSGVMPQMLTEPVLREQLAELRRTLVASVDTQSERITAEIRAVLLEAVPPAPPAASEPVPAMQERRPSQWPWLVAALALAVAVVTTSLWYEQQAELQALNVEVARLQVAKAAESTIQAETQTAPEPAAAPAAQSDEPALPPAASQTSAGATTQPAVATVDGKAVVIAVPYGADALGGARLEQIRQLLDRLVREDHHGRVDVKAFAGRFCLMGNSTDGYSLAPDDTPYSKCDLVGNPADDALLPAQRTPLPFVNQAEVVRSKTNGALDVRASSGDPKSVVAPYPAVSPELSAGEWNRAASANNRVEIRVR